MMLSITCPVKIYVDWRNEGGCGSAIYQTWASSNLLNYQILDFEIDYKNINPLIDNRHSLDRLPNEIGFSYMADPQSPFCILWLRRFSGT